MRAGMIVSRQEAAALYAPPPMLPRPYLPLPPGQVLGMQRNVPSPNPDLMRVPQAQFAPATLPGPTIQWKPLKGIPPAERTSFRTIQGNWAQFPGAGVREQIALPVLSGPELGNPAESARSPLVAAAVSILGGAALTYAFVKLAQSLRPA